MPVQPNHIELGPESDVQTVTAIGRTYSEAYEDGLFIEERSASGKLRRDVITDKIVFTLDFEVAKTETVDRFESLYLSHQELILKVQKGATLKAYVVLMSPFSRERLLAVGGGLWSGLTIELREV